MNDLYTELYTNRERIVYKDGYKSSTGSRGGPYQEPAKDHKSDVRRKSLPRKSLTDTCFQASPQVVDM